MRLKGKTSVVTGASRGIGRAVSAALESEGARVCRLSSANCDLRDPRAIDRACRAILAEHPSIDIMVNNAGVIGPIGAVDKVDYARLSEAFAVNTIGAMAITGHLISALTRADGIVVFIGTGAARHPIHGWSTYSASKAALAMYGRCLHLEYPNLLVYNMDPGAVNTAMQGAIRKSGFGPTANTAPERLLPPEMVGRTIAELCVQRPWHLRGIDFSYRDILEAPQPA